MKKAFALLALVLVFAIALVSCGNGTTETTTNEETTVSTTTQNQEIAAPGDDYVKIENAEDFLDISDDLSGKYYLVADIDLGGADLSPIGNASTPFSGEIIGNGFTVSNFVITKSSNYIALFGYNTGKIINLSADGFALNVNYTSYGDAYIAGFVGYNDGEITNCYSGGSVSVESHSYATLNVGGFAGGNAGTVKACYSTGKLHANAGSIEGKERPEEYISCVGGFVGINTYEIANCYATGAVDANSKGYSFAGGFAGQSNGVIVNSYAVGNVRAISSVYSIAGAFVASLDKFAETENCLATGNVSVTAELEENVFAGGFVGKNSSEVINNVYRYDVQQMYVEFGGTIKTVAHNEIGTPASSELINSVDFYKTTLKWNPSIWNMTSFNFGIEEYLTLK